MATPGSRHMQVPLPSLNSMALLRFQDVKDRPLFFYCTTQSPGKRLAGAGSGAFGKGDVRSAPAWCAGHVLEHGSALSRPRLLASCTEFCRVNGVLHKRIWAKNKTMRVG